MTGKQQNIPPLLREIIEIDNRIAALASQNPFKLSDYTLLLDLKMRRRKLSETAERTYGKAFSDGNNNGPRTA